MARVCMESAAATAASKQQQQQQQQGERWEEPRDDVAVELVLAMVAARQAEEDEAEAEAKDKGMAVKVTAEEARLALQQEDGDVERAVNELMSVLAIRSLQEESDRDNSHTNNHWEDSPNSGGNGGHALQWRELCEALGLSDCHAFVGVLQSLPEPERDAILSSQGGFFQQLLLLLEEEEQQQDARLGDGPADEEMHPLAQLQALFPDTRMNVIEDVFEQQGFDLNATATALQNVQALDSVHSYAAVVKTRAATRALVPNARQQQQYQQYQQNQDEDGDTPVVSSLGHFPALSADSGQGSPGLAAGSSDWRRVPAHKLRGKKSKAKRGNQAAGPIPGPHAIGRRQPHVVSAWDASSDPANGRGPGPEQHVVVQETGLTSQLKIERLQRLLPRIDHEVIRATFYLNGCSSDATEAALRETYSLPLVTRLNPAVDDDDGDAVVAATLVNQHAEAEDTSYSGYRSRVDDCWQNLSDRYCSALQSFNRNQHIIAVDRVREISRARRALRDAQEEAAHAFVESHRQAIRHQEAIDLHGLTVRESLYVAREAIEICRSERIRRCLLICGMGNHSINQKARLLTAIQLSLERRRIAFRKDGGVLFVYPLRSTS